MIKYPFILLVFAYCLIAESFATNNTDSIKSISSSKSVNDTAFIQKTAVDSTKKYKAKLSYKQFIIPAIFISYGVIVRMDLNDEVTHLDFSTRREILEDNPGFYTFLDNYTQFAPAVTAFGLQAIGIKG